MNTTPTLRRSPLLVAAALLLAVGCPSKDEEPKSDEDIWNEATGEEGAPAEPAAEEPAPAEAAPAAAEGAGAEGEGEDGAGSEAEGDAEGDAEEGEGEDPSSAADGPAPTEVYADGSRLYGTKPDATKTVTALSDLMGDADRFDGQVVRTQGEIARVCQAMGCWMELRPGAEDASIRVPMAGHAFFLPKDVAGRRATVQGRVAVRAPSPEVQAHLRSEGALAAAQPISLEATGVVVH